MPESTGPSGQLDSTFAYVSIIFSIVRISRINMMKEVQFLLSHLLFKSGILFCTVLSRNG